MTGGYGNQPDRTGVLIPSNALSIRENEGEPARCVNTPPALTSTPFTSGKEADVDIIAHSRPLDSQAQQDSIQHLRQLLAESIRKRDRLVELIDRHWYVEGDGDYCLACNLPERNGRHAARSA